MIAVAVLALILGIAILFTLFGIFARVDQMAGALARLDASDKLRTNRELAEAALWNADQQETSK